MASSFLPVETLFTQRGVFIKSTLVAKRREVIIGVPRCHRSGRIFANATLKKKQRNAVRSKRVLSNVVERFG